MSEPYYEPVPDVLRAGTTYFNRRIMRIEDTNLGLRPGDRSLYYVDTDDPKQTEHFSLTSFFLAWLRARQQGHEDVVFNWRDGFVPATAHTPRKRVDTPEGSFRMRRGKLVRIPDKWVGRTVHPQEVRARRSKKGRGRRFKRKAMR